MITFAPPSVYINDILELKEESVQHFLCHCLALSEIGTTYLKAV